MRKRDRKINKMSNNVSSPCKKCEIGRCKECVSENGCWCHKPCSPCEEYLADGITERYQQGLHKNCVGGGCFCFRTWHDPISAEVAAEEKYDPLHCSLCGGARGHYGECK